ncbi:PleD family two-component system response regulator [candidate division KSB1 bacterium]|nr:PleD family two-component system response regulator [candidate division KSB1 bacterium]
MKYENSNHHPKILVVDDIPVNIQLLQAFLATEKYKTYIARNGVEALKQAEAVEPDLILLDVMMPKMNGFETCKLLKKSEKARYTPIIMVTALNEIESKIQGIEAGADDFISKPFNKLELLARVKSLLRVKTLHDQLQDKIVQLERAKERLRELAVTDGLTGLKNYRHFKDVFSLEIKRAERHKSPLSLIMFDIDYFKNYNDTHGHLAGDRVLQDIAILVLKNIRKIDLAARYGGEEFALILPNTDIKNSRIVAEKIRKLVEDYHFPFQESQPDGSITISVGVSSYPSCGKSFEELVACADKRLYLAKARGKNIVVDAGEC